jgi:hypothetical protein
LAATFDAGDPMVNHIADDPHAERHSQLARTIRLNRDLRYPNFHKVPPLPPAQLPRWDGNLEILVDAAKGLVAVPVVQPTPGAERTSRAHIPDGHVLPADPALPFFIC